MKVSIILPTYQRPHCIHETIDSILAQTCPDWELIISNNGKDVYQFTDPRIRIVDSSEITSAAYARNKAIPQAIGDLICFFDDDDLMYPDYIQAMRQPFLDSEKVMLVRCKMKVDRFTDASFATPECMVRRHLATDNWQPFDRHDQIYWRKICGTNGLFDHLPNMVFLDLVLCEARRNPKGGLRKGKF